MEVEKMTDLDWKIRCFMLESQLDKFKTQASKVREVLGNKMEELEQQIQSSQARAEKSEREFLQAKEQLARQASLANQNAALEGLHLQVRLLGTQLKEKEELIGSLETRLSSNNSGMVTTPLDSSSQVDRLRQRIGQLELECQEKDGVIESLGKDLKEQEKAVELKAAQIKELVKTKLQELHKENTSLIQANQECNKTIQQLNQKLGYQNTDGSGSPIRASVSTPNFSKPLSAIENVVDISLQSQTLPAQLNRPVGSPGGEAGFAYLADKPPLPGRTLSTREEEKAKPGRKLSADHSEPGNYSTDLNSNKVVSTLAAAPADASQSGQPPMATGQSGQLPTATGQSGQLPMATGQSGQLPAATRSIRQMLVVNGSLPLSTSHASAKAAAAAAAKFSSLPNPAIAGQQPSKPFIPQYAHQAVGLSHSTGGGGSIYPGRPPLPGHKLPAWEKNIFTAAKSGLKMGKAPGKDDSLTREPSMLVYEANHNCFTNLMHSKGAEVPVYTYYNGKVVQVRSSAFQGDGESEDSDSEPETNALPAAIANTRSVSPAGNKKKRDSLKRVMSITTVSSDGDYCVPPDALSSTGSEPCEEPEQKLLKTSDHLNNTLKSLEEIEKSGYLGKLGSKVKTWKQRWFIIQNNRLFYYKSNNEMLGKPLGEVVIDGLTRIKRSSDTSGANTFEITTTKKTYYLMAKSAKSLTQWIQVLQALQRRLVTNAPGEPTEAKAVIKGWLTRAKCGLSRKCWCILANKTLCFFAHRKDKAPALGTIYLSQAKVKEVDSRWCEPEQGDGDQPAATLHTISLHVNDQEPLYLTFTSGEEKSAWFYHLTVASGSSGMHELGTETERLLGKLLDCDGDLSSPYWRHPVLTFTSEPIEDPLITLSALLLKKEGVHLFKSCQKFAIRPIDSAVTDHHVSLAQSIIQTCLDHPPLQSEVFCQLVKQLSPKYTSGKHSNRAQSLWCGANNWFSCNAGSSSNSPSSSLADLTLSSPFEISQQAVLQYWQLLAMCTAIFAPKERYLWLLRNHLQKNNDARLETGKYAIFCQRSLERTIEAGGRTEKPSQLEVLSYLLRHPYHHSLPISIPVNLVNGSYQVVGFDSQTTVKEFLRSLNQEIGVRDLAQSGFALYTNDPCGLEVEHCLQLNLNLGDVLSKWEQAAKNSGNNHSQTIKLTYKNRMYMRKMVKGETEKEKYLLVHQTNSSIVSERFPLSRDLAIELAALMTQMEFGDYTERSPNTADHVIQALESFYPSRYLQGSGVEDKVRAELEVKWRGLKGCSQPQCVATYLQVTRQWPCFGAKLFTVRPKFGSLANTAAASAWMAIGDEAIHLLDYLSMQALTTYSYRHIATFGGFNHDFMLMVSHASQPTMEKLLFEMPKAKAAEVTHLIANYMNALPNKH